MAGELETEVLDEDPLESTNFSASKVNPITGQCTYFRCCESPSPCHFSGITNSIMLESPFDSSGFL